MSTNDEVYFWVAINGNAVSCASIPFTRAFKCSPVPELLLGFSTLQEAKAFRHFVLTAPLLKVRRRIADLLGSGISSIEPAHPEASSREPTVWSISKDMTPLEEK